MSTRASIAILVLAGSLVACAEPRAPEETPVAKSGTRAPATTGTIVKTVKTDEEWKRTLTPDPYDVLRKQGIERAFTGKYWNTQADGSYVRAGCGA
jgi:peptide-methionine (R)-S-oxide reductase